MFSLSFTDTVSDDKKNQYDFGLMASVTFKWRHLVTNVTIFHIQQCQAYVIIHEKYICVAVSVFIYVINI